MPAPAGCAGNAAAVAYPKGARRSVDRSDVGGNSWSWLLKPTWLTMICGLSSLTRSVTICPPWIIAGSIVLVCRMRPLRLAFSATHARYLSAQAQAHAHAHPRPRRRADAPGRGYQRVSSRHAPVSASTRAAGLPVHRGRSSDYLSSSFPSSTPQPPDSPGRGRIVQ